MRNEDLIFRVFPKKDFYSTLILIQHHKPECLGRANEKSKVTRSKEDMYLLIYSLLEK